MYGLSPVATSSKVLEYQEKLGFFQPSTASKPPAALRSSASADRDFKMPKNPGTMRFSGVFLFVLFWLNLTQPNRFYRGQLGDNSPFFVFMGQLRGQPREQLLGILG